VKSCDFFGSRFKQFFSGYVGSEISFILPLFLFSTMGFASGNDMNLSNSSNLLFVENTNNGKKANTIAFSFFTFLS